MAAEPDQSVDWVDLPVWLKGAVDRGDEELAFWRQLQWFKSNDGSTYFAFDRHGAAVDEFAKE